MVTKPNQQVLDGIDQAALEAEKQFRQLPVDGRAQVTMWYRDWYLKAGYTRLGKVILGSFVPGQRK